MAVEAYRGKVVHHVTEDRVENRCSELGCWKTFRLFHLGSVEENVRDEKYCYLDNIGVDVSLRGKGVGKLLLDRAEWEARNRGCSVIYLYVTTDNRARGLYERQGYEVTDRTSCYGCLWCCIGPPGSVFKMEKKLIGAS